VSNILAKTKTTKANFLKATATKVIVFAKEKKYKASRFFGLGEPPAAPLRGIGGRRAVRSSPIFSRRRTAVRLYEKKTARPLPSLSLRGGSTARMESRFSF
jgi:hypothetical protein